MLDSLRYSRPRQRVWTLAKSAVRAKEPGEETVGSMPLSSGACAKNAKLQCYYVRRAAALRTGTYFAVETIFAFANIHNVLLLRDAVHHAPCIYLHLCCRENFETLCDISRDMHGTKITAKCNIDVDRRVVEALRRLASLAMRRGGGLTLLLFCPMSSSRLYRFSP